jgi:cobalt-zinc-cadmium efflux system membrane fusion protein
MASRAMQPEPEDPTSAPPVATDTTLRFTSERAQRSGIRSVAVASERVVPTVDLIGNVAFNPSRIADIGGRLEGRVVRVYVEHGDHVEPGDPLVSIEGADLGEAVADLLEARAELAAASSLATRQTTLRSGQLTTATALESATAEQASVAARVSGAEQRLRNLGLDPAAVGRPGSALPRTVTLRAPIAGEVVERHVHLGAVVDPTQPLMRIADLSEVWIVLNAFERDIARVREGSPVDVQSDAYPGRTFQGAVEHVGATVDEITRTTDVRVLVQNTERLLRPGQFVRATLHMTQDAEREIVLIPRDAVFQLEGQPSVFVELEPLAYEPRALQLGEPFGTRVEVVHGLSIGDDVVVEGGFALKSELER